MLRVWLTGSSPFIQQAILDLYCAGPDLGELSISLEETAQDPTMNV